METYKQRLKRFTEGPPNESIGTLTNSIANFFINNELEIACQKKLWSLLIVGIFAVIETVADVLYGNSREIKNIKKYHKIFIDSDGINCDFSKIADEINEWRNALAHKWIYKKGHYLYPNPSMKEGWKRENGTLIVNPKIYYECFKRAFGTNGKMWQLEDIFSEAQLLNGKNRMIKKFMGVD